MSRADSSRSTNERAATDRRRATSPHANSHRALEPAAVTLIAFGAATIVSGLLVGAIAFIPSSNALDAMCPRRMCPANGETHSLFDRTQQLAWAADVLVGVGALYAIAGGAWLVATRVHGEERVRASVIAGSNEVAIVVSGRF